MNNDPDRAFYGYFTYFKRSPTHINIASERGAIQTLLISDDLLRCRFLKIFNDVKENGGKIVVFCGLHETGQELNQYSGIAAILRYPMEDLDIIPVQDISTNLALLKF
ncbi:hypothetical protein HZS_6000 [Henneguya salminicola]|nr:hypothetical protein HZS_6000 [Henneguya salminicola]